MSKWEEWGFMLSGELKKLKEKLEGKHVSIDKDRLLAELQSLDKVV